MWFLPSYKRPEQARRAIESMVACGMQEPGVLITNDNDPSDYGGVELPANWTRFRVPGDDIRVNDCWRAAFARFSNEPWYGLMSDDMVVRTPGFEQALIEKAGAKSIASSNDLWQAPKRMTGATVFGGDLVRVVGDLAPIPTRHCFFDDFWEMVGRDFGCWDVLMDVHVEHLHPYAGKAQDDETHSRANGDMMADQQRFVDWCRANKGVFYKRIGDALGRHTKVVNLAGTHLVIGTPAYSNQFTGNYLRSLLHTKEALAGLGVQMDLITVPSESLITRARNHIVKQFRDTKASHLIMIDADMGWSAQSVVRLLVASQDVDIVGGAGPRKATPLTFCANFPGGGVLEVHPANGLLRVEEMGSGFMMMTRKAIDLMYETYTELRYIEPPSMMEVSALFDCMIQAGRYWSEDFAFCRRWRMLGGSLWVDPQITLEHVGQFTWKGDLHTHLVEKQAEAAAAEVAAKAAATTPVADVVDNIISLADVPRQAAE